MARALIRVCSFIHTPRSWRRTLLAVPVLLVALSAAADQPKGLDQALLVLPKFLNKSRSEGTFGSIDLQPSPGIRLQVNAGVE